MLDLYLKWLLKIKIKWLSASVKTDKLDHIVIFNLLSETFRNLHGHQVQLFFVDQRANNWNTNVNKRFWIVNFFIIRILVSNICFIAETTSRKCHKSRNKKILIYLVSGWLSTKKLLEEDLGDESWLDKSFSCDIITVSFENKLWKLICIYWFLGVLRTNSIFRTTF